MSFSRYYDTELPAVHDAAGAERGETAMPAIMTHDFFGRDALEMASQLTDLSQQDLREAFLLGNQGPDPLFYLLADPTVDASMRMGAIMHHARPAALLTNLHDALTMLTQSERARGQAYAAGFLCHYLLDSSEHPLVYAQQYAICDAGIEKLDRSDGSLVHAEIERDLDEMVLYTKRHETIQTWRPYREVLGGSDELLATIDKLYFYMNLWTYNRTLDTDVFTHAVHAFRRVQRLFWAPGFAKRRALGDVELLFSHGRYSLYRAMAHRVRAEETSAFDNSEHRAWTNPFTHQESQASFWDLYESAQKRVSAAEEAFFQPSFALKDAVQLTGNLNFSGEPSAPDAPVEEGD